MIKSAWNLRIDPRPYQREATQWALAKGQAVCSLPTGTGKTLVAVLWLKSAAGFARRYAELARNLAGKETDIQRKAELERIAETCAD